MAKKDKAINLTPEKVKRVQDYIDRLLHEPGFAMQVLLKDPDYVAAMLKKYPD